MAAGGVEFTGRALLRRYGGSSYGGSRMGSQAGTMRTGMSTLSDMSTITGFDEVIRPL
jgi:hypothetical protein